jgi:putative membrane protein
MMWGNDWGWGGWVLGFLMMLVFWGGLAALIVLLVRGTDRTSGRQEPRSDPHDPDAILRERLARGEISVEEYEERKKVLQDASR